MKHKSIIGLLSLIFSFGMGLSLLTLFANFTIVPELFFVLAFTILICICIVFFKVVDKIKNENHKSQFVDVINQDLYIFKDSNTPKRRNLFLKVSIII